MNWTAGRLTSQIHPRGGHVAWLGQSCVVGADRCGVHTSSSGSAGGRWLDSRPGWLRHCRCNCLVRLQVLG